MEGLYFYWLAWLGWIWATFFMGKNNPERYKIAVLLLAVIMAAPFKGDFLIFEFHLSACAMMLFLIYGTWRKKASSFFYLFLSSFIIMMAYTSFLMFELYDPVWVLFDRKIMLGAIGFYLAILLHKNKYQRVLSLIAGFLLGDILFSVIIGRFNFPYAISSLGFLDTLFISMASLIVWSAVETAISVMSGSAIHQAEGEEHKTS